MGRQHRVVGFHDRCRDPRSGVYGKFELRLLAIVRAEALKEQCTKPRSGTASEGMENEESLERGTVICNLSASLQELFFY